MVQPAVDTLNMLPFMATACGAVMVAPCRFFQAIEDSAIGHQPVGGALLVQGKQLLLQRPEFRDTRCDVANVPVE